MFHKSAFSSGKIPNILDVPLLEELILDGKYSDALHELETVMARSSITKALELLLEVLKAEIHIAKGEFTLSEQITSKTLEKALTVNNLFYHIDAILTIVDN